MEGLGPMMLKMLMSLHLSSGYAGSDLQFNQLETGIPDLRSAIDGTGQYPILLFGCVAEASGNGLVRNHAVSTDFHPYSTWSAHADPYSGIVRPKNTVGFSCGLSHPETAADKKTFPVDTWNNKPNYPGSQYIQLFHPAL